MEDWFSGGNRNRDSTWKTGFYIKAENISTSSVASLQLKSPPARMSWVPRCKKQSWTSWKPPRCPGRSFTNVAKRTKFSTTSFQLRPWSPPMGLPPPPRNMRSGYLRVYFLLISGSFFMLNFHFHEEKNSLEARLVVTVNVETIHVQASYQRRSQRQHFSVNSGEFRISLCDFLWPFQNVYKVYWCIVSIK